MICPVDQELMLAIEYRQVELDYCPTCEGIWLDAGEIELLVPESSKVEFLERIRLIQAVQEKPLKCPRCAAKMDKVQSDILPEVIFDACKNGHGFWFDKGELQQILIKELEGNSTDELVAFLKSLFHAEKDDNKEGENNRE